MIGKMSGDVNVYGPNHITELLAFLAEEVENRDVFLRTEGGGYLQCHKILLGAFSPFLKQLLTSIPAEEPALILLPDHTEDEMRDLLEQMYCSQPDLLHRSHILCPDPPAAWRSELEAQLAEALAPVKAEAALQKRMTEEEEEAADHWDIDGSDFTDEKLRRRPRIRRSKHDPSDLVEKIPPVAAKSKKKRSKFPVECPHCSTLLTDRKKKAQHECFRKNRERKRQSRAEVGLVNEATGEVLEMKPVICHLCGISFSTSLALTSHLQMKCGNVCDICKQVFQNRTEVKTHLFEAHHKVSKRRNYQENYDKQFECQKCDRKYTRQAQLNLHILQVHSEQQQIKFQCQDCGKLVGSPLALRKHVSLHKPPAHSCPICGKMFHNRYYLSRHALSQHADQSTKKHRCDMCEKGFNNKEALAGHRNWHLNLKPHQCRWCDRSYQNSSNCAAHERKTHRDVYESSLKNGNRRFQMRETPAILNLAV